MSETKPIQSCNDFVIKFANVNGSGSASANELFARSIMRMGVPVAPRNIFPSNIQGMPTWYEMRVSEAGWLGRRGGCELMVAMNPQTWDRDIAEIEAGGYLVYDSTKALPRSRSLLTVWSVAGKIRVCAAWLVTSPDCQRPPVTTDQRGPSQICWSSAEYKVKSLVKSSCTGGSSGP